MDLNAVLKMTPGTFTTPNSVQLYGRNVSKVYLNGRELKLSGEQLISYLESIEAKNVKEMEVITASGVEEDATSKGKSIIKITTINPETGGMANVSGSTLDGKDKNMHTLSGNVNWRINPKWRTYVNLSSALGNTDRGSRNETHFYETDERRIHTSKVENDLKNIRGVWGITYDLDKNNLFSVEGTLWKNRNENPTSAFTRSLMNGTSTDIAEEFPHRAHTLLPFGRQRALWKGIGKAAMLFRYCEGIHLRVNYNFRWGQKSMVRRGMSDNMEEMTRIVTE